MLNHDLYKPYKIHHLIEIQAKIRPTKTAIVFSNQTLSYGELNAKANQFAQYLIEHQIKPGDIVPILSNKSLILFIMFLGILKTDAAYSPLNADSPTKHIETVVKETKAKCICIEPNLLDRFAFDKNVLVINSDEIEKQMSPYADNNVESSNVVSDLAYVIYTSGTTGNPKGGMIAHANLLPTYFSWEEAYHLTSADVHLQMAPVGFDVFVGDWIRALCSGATLVLCPKNSLVEPEKLYRLIEQEKITCAEFVPAILRQLINFVEKNHCDLSQFRLLICGSDQWTMGEYRAVKKICGKKTHLISSYGLTETTIDSSFYEEDPTCSSLDNKSIVPIGKPFKHVNLYLVNDDKLALPGETGEIYIGGSGVSLGYLNQQKLTLDKFVFRTFKNDISERLYRTGDQGTLLLDGNFLFLGRNQDHIKIHGKRVDLPSLEATINQHPKIKFAIVTPIFKSDSDEIILKCFFTLKDGPLTHKDLIHHIREVLPCYYVPQKFYQVESIPLSVNGKVDKRVGSQKIIRELQLEIYLPRTTIQNYLVQLWKKTLKIDELGIKNSFYDLGGSSLSFVAMLNEVNKKFNLKILPNVKIETIEELSKYIENCQLVLTKQSCPPIFVYKNSRQTKYMFSDPKNIFSPIPSLAQRHSNLPFPKIHTRSPIYSFFPISPPRPSFSPKLAEVTGVTKALLSLVFRR